MPDDEAPERQDAVVAIGTVSTASEAQSPPDDGSQFWRDIEARVAACRR